MPRKRRERNHAILRLSKLGVRPSTLAVHHGLSCGRITHILAAHASVDKRRADLERQYGRDPNIAQLSDDTPIDVLILKNQDAHGWDARVLSLSKGPAPLRTLGDLRRMTDAALLARSGVGKVLFNELRKLCPCETAETAARTTQELIDG